MLAGASWLKQDPRAAAAAAGAGFANEPPAAAVPGSSHRRAASLKDDEPAAVTLLSWRYVVGAAADDGEEMPAAEESGTESVKLRLQGGSGSLGNELLGKYQGHVQHPELRHLSALGCGGRARKKTCSCAQDRCLIWRQHATHRKGMRRSQLRC